jgi:histone acetyltransferase MYST1
VLWRDNKTISFGEVIERRLSSHEEEGEEEGQHADEYEYYVHYWDHDRRLDEWVPVERLDLVAGPQPKPAGGGGGHGHGHGHGHHGMNKKRKLEVQGSSSSSSNNKDLGLKAVEKEHEEITKVKNIQFIELGKYEIETWYYSPFPTEYGKEDRLHICEFCLKYMRRRKTLNRHKLDCTQRHPPGDEIYRDGSLTVFEVDGKTNKIYCQNLCLLAKLFLDHKTLYYDVDPFLFYILCESDDKGYHVVGYFSKEKSSAENYNLACILTFPPYQRHGYGKFLISLSYELTKREGKVGSPEKPLSDLGKLSYRSYWTYVLLSVLKDEPSISFKDLSLRTGIKMEDILSTLQSINMVRFWKGQYVIMVSRETLDAHLESGNKMNLCKPQFLTWTPPVLPKK